MSHESSLDQVSVSLLLLLRWLGLGLKFLDARTGHGGTDLIQVIINRGSFDA